MELSLENDAKALLNVNLQVDELKINDVTFADGIYSADNYPDYFEDRGKITVGTGIGINPTDWPDKIEVNRNWLIVHGNNSNITIFSVLGEKIMSWKNENMIDLNGLKAGNLYHNL